MRKFLLAILAVATIAVALPGSAEAYYYGPRVVVGIPFFAPPPVYYAPPPVSYAPPPVYAAPAPVYGGRSCYAGPYVCPLERPTPVGAGCSCPTNGGRAYGDSH